MTDTSGISLSSVALSRLMGAALLVLAVFHTLHTSAVTREASGLCRLGKTDLGLILFWGGDYSSCSLARPFKEDSSCGFKAGLRFLFSNVLNIIKAKDKLTLRAADYLFCFASCLRFTDPAFFWGGIILNVSDSGFSFFLNIQEKYVLHVL